MFAGASCNVLRILLSLLLFLTIASASVTQAVAGPLLRDDVATCRERQAMPRSG
jgi:hypothetical protein